MVSRDDLLNRKYDGREIIAFDYISEPDEDGEFYKVSFQRATPTHWQAVMTNFSNLSAASASVGASVSTVDVIAVDYEMPKANMPLEHIATVGLSTLQLAFNSTYARYSVWSMELYRKVH